MQYEFGVWIHKNHESDFCYELIDKLNFYEFMYLKQ